LIPGLDGDQAAFRRGNGGNLIKGHRCIIALDFDTVKQGCRGPSGPDFAEVAIEGVNGFIHFLAKLGKDFLFH
jgi:hypothetical protein